MAVEIQFETLAQHRLVDLADPALPGGAGIRHRDVDPAEGGGDLRERIPHRCGVGDVASEPKRGAADRPGFGLRGGLVDIQQRHFGAGRRERFRGRKSDRTRSTGDDGDLSRQRQLLCAAELRLLERPVFDIEQIGLRQRLEAADGFRIGDGGNRGFGEIGGDVRVLLAAAEPEQADTGHQHHARRGIEHGLDPADARVVAGEIILIGFAICRDGVADRSLKPARSPSSGAATTSGWFLMRIL